MLDEKNMERQLLLVPSWGKKFKSWPVEGVAARSVPETQFVQSILNKFIRMLWLKKKQHYKSGESEPQLWGTAVGW